MSNQSVKKNAKTHAPRVNIRGKSTTDSSSYYILSRNVKIDQTNGLLMVTKVFAERHLSPSARKYACKVDDDFYYWNWGRESSVVVFEVPRIFNLQFTELMRYLYTYCIDYLKENDLRESVLYYRYMDNFNKDLRL